MITETQIVNEIVAMAKKDPQKYTGWGSRTLRWSIIDRLYKDRGLAGGYCFSIARPERSNMVARLERRIRKKLGQPFRRKARGPKRAKAAGKNEVTRRR